jgi:hypothetical protein
VVNKPSGARRVMDDVESTRKRDLGADIIEDEDWFDDVDRA